MSGEQTATSYKKKTSIAFSSLLLRLRSFQLKTNSGITFTSLCVFGSNRKYGQMENQLHVDYKITHFSHKINYTLILSSNDFQDSERERERERESIGFRNPSPLSSTHSPMRERCNSTPHTDAGLRSLHSDEQRRHTRSTKPHLHPLWALDVPNPPRQNYPSRWRSPSHFQHLRSVTPMSLAKNFSQTHPL